MSQQIDLKGLNGDLTTDSSIDEHVEFRLLAESIPHLAWIARKDGWIFWYNQRWYQYTGKTPEQMEGWGWQDVHDPAVLPSVMASWQKSIEQNEPFEMKFPLKGADGIFRMFLTRSVPMKDSDGHVLRWFGTNTDISAENDTVLALRESEQRFRTATQAIDGVLWTNNAQGQMVGEQPGWSQFTGQTPDEYLGYGWASAVHPEDAQPTIDEWQMAVRENRLFRFEHRVRRHDGVYRLCAIRALPVRDDDGSVREWVGVHTDITEELERQQTLRETVTALRQQQELVEAAQQMSDAGFWRYQPSNGELYLSSGSRRLLSLPAHGPVTMQDAYLSVHPDDRASVVAAMEEGLRGGEHRLEFRSVSPTGECRWLLSVARMLSPTEGENYFVGMHLDITKQKKSVDTLMQTEKLAVAGRLAATIAHEINNPLEAVTNLLYLLQHSELDAEQQAYCALMADELRRVSEITTHTLRFHRQSTLPALTRVEDLLQSVLALFKGRMQNAGITAECRFRYRGELFGYNGEIRQVLANLVGNSIDAMAGGTKTRRLLVRTVSESRRGCRGVVITVADTGPGIPKSDAHQIFDPFFTTKGEVGTGLGLWVSSEIVSKHNGDIRFRSRQTAHGSGTVFRVFLPHDELDQRK